MTEKRSMSLFKIIALVLMGLSFIMLFLPWLSVSASFLGQNMSEGLNIFETGGNGNISSFWSVMLIIFAILTLVAIGLGVLGVIKDRTVYALPLAGLALLMFTFAICQVLFVRHELKDQVGSLSGIAKIHVGAGAWLFLVFCLGAFGVLYYESCKNGRRSLDLAQLKDFSQLTKPAAANGWKCPACGAQCAETQSFCMNCGAKKPEPRLCPACGTPNNDGAAYCRNCGTKLPEE